MYTEYIPVEKKKRKPQIKNGTMHKLIVYENGAIVGYGFIIRYTNGDMSKPDLYDFKGERLPEGWYNLQITHESHNVVVPRNVQ